MDKQTDNQTYCQLDRHRQAKIETMGGKTDSYTRAIDRHTEGKLDRRTSKYSGRVYTGRQSRKQAEELANRQADTDIME
jgi:hypothetical protein